MQDLSSARLMWLKAVLLFLIGVAASTLLLAECRTLRVALLLAAAIWGFCRAYYFAFYVVEHYVDDTYRFSGLISFLRYVLRKKERRPKE